MYCDTAMMLGLYNPGLNEWVSVKNIISQMIEDKYSKK